MSFFDFLRLHHILSRTFDFRGDILAEAIEKTFENRNTPLPIKPTVFDPSFITAGDKKVQWLGFIRKAKLSDAPEAFEDVVAAIKVFIEPVIDSYAGRSSFHLTWNAPGPWR